MRFVCKYVFLCMQVIYTFRLYACAFFMGSERLTGRCHCSLLQGNIGSAVELGTYGLGLRGNAVRGTNVSGVYLHRITQALSQSAGNTSQEDNLGSVLGSRTCPFGITLDAITISNLYIPRLGAANAISRLFALGTYGAPAPRWAESSPLDRCEHLQPSLSAHWFGVCLSCACGECADSFCANEWWRQEGDFEQQIQTGGATAATFSRIRFVNWRIYVNPQALSLLYNFHLEGVSRFEGIAFYDDSLAAPSSGWPWAGAVRIYRGGDPTGDFSTPCLGDPSCPFLVHTS